MLESIVIAVIVAVIVGASLVYLLGPIIKSLPAPIAQIVGNFFVVWGWGIGILAGLLYFISGGGNPFD